MARATSSFPVAGEEVISLIHWSDRLRIPIGSKTEFDRGRVKTHRADAPSNIDLSESSVFDYFSLRKGKTTPETETALRFYTASATSGRSCSAQKCAHSGRCNVVGTPPAPRRLRSVPCPLARPVSFRPDDSFNTVASLRGWCASVWDPGTRSSRHATLSGIGPNSSRDRGAVDAEP